MKKFPQWSVISWIPGILFVAVSLTSCQKADPQMNNSSEQMSEQMKQDIALISSLGYDIADIEKTDDGYLVEGDIWLTDEWLEEAGQQPQTRLTQHNKGYLTSQQYQNKLYMNVGNLTSSSALWTNPATNAIAQWNAVAKCYISISNTSGSNLQEIKIKFENKSSFGNSTAKLMKVTPPSSDGKPGSVTLNADCTFLPDVNNLFDSKVQNNAMYLIMHAIGHSLGLGHSLRNGQLIGDDEDWGTPSNGTSQYDNKSIMTKETSPISWTGFSTQDKRELSLIFPIPGFTAGSIEETKTISQTTGVFSINSVKDASGGTGTIIYAWEKKSDGKWTSISGQTGKNLTNAPVTTELTSEYRRKAVNGTKTLYSNICTVTNSMYEPLTAGSIADTLLIDTANPNEQLRINSTQAAVCPRSAIRYTWETKTGDSWTTIPSAVGESLVTPAPMTFTAMYRRKAACDHENRYSNICTVYNKSFLSGGTIPELIELNKTGFNRFYFDIPYLTEPSLTASKSTWEVYKNGFWTPFGSDAKHIRLPIPEQRITKYRASISTPFGPAYSNECTIVNCAYLEDPRQGTDWGTNILKLGPYDNGFTKIMAIDSSGEYFRDFDRLRGCGNDICIELEITSKMYIQIKTGSVPVSVWLDVWAAEASYSGVSSEPYAEAWPSAEYIPFPTFADEIPGPIPDPDAYSFFLIPGKYQIQLQGCPKYNYSDISVANQVICFSLRGTCMDHDPTIPIPTPQQ